MVLNHMPDIADGVLGVKFLVMVLNPTFNNISAISRQSVLLVEENGYERDLNSQH
jgi:hypothetical protein